VRRGLQEEVYTAGVITPAMWDDDGNVLGISIHTLDEKEYLVDPDQVGRELRSFIYKKIEVLGIVKATGEAKPVISVKSYKTITD
jgi:hypothetical protein